MAKKMENVSRKTAGRSKNGGRVKKNPFLQRERGRED